MNIGRLDVCLRVNDVGNSEAFYEKLGFQRAEGNPEEGWSVVSDGQARIGLFEAQYMDSDFSLNFRDGDILSIVSELSGKGITLDKPLRGSPDKGYSATLRDPDGYVIFLDSDKTN